MVVSSPVRWYDRPARPFPALVWLERRYPFRVPMSACAWATVQAASDGAGRRPFPALVWLAGRQAGVQTSTGVRLDWKRWW